ncbi:MAG: hypothetical protein JWO37_3691 [Acidimicrobiales bacterium]|jgi:hypothetical protein|nr:hypothetical protein [Acidimicrobiales bacterium]
MPGPSERCQHRVQLWPPITPEWVRESSDRLRSPPVVRWWAESDEAWAADDAGVRWHGTLIGPAVHSAMELPGTEDGIIVLDWSRRPPDVLEWHPYPNLLRARPDGTVVWRADLPPGETLGSWTGAAIENGQLIGFGWESRCRIDMATGEVLDSTFTK